MKTIPLKDGKEAIVDDEDYIVLSRFHWGLSVHSTETPIREFTLGKRTVVIPMWKFIIPSESNKEILFKNRDSLDLRKENLMVVPIYVANHKAMKKGRGVNGEPSSKYKGVSYSKTYQGNKKWLADIVCNGKRFHKHCLTENEAAEAYNEKAIEFYGEHAYLNIIVPVTENKKVSNCCHASMSVKPQENTALHYSECDQCKKPCRAIPSR